MLDELQTSFLRYFVDTGLSNQFYFTGGTALAEVYLHHRASFDLDFFTAQSFDYEELVRLLSEFARINKLKEPRLERKYDRRMFFLTNGGELKVEFVKFEHPSLKPKTVWNDYNIEVDSTTDIATNKTLALIDRQEPKDVVDLYYLMKHIPCSIDDLLEHLKQKFGVAYQPFSLAADFVRVSQDLSVLTPHLIAPNPSEEIQTIASFFKDLAEQENPFKLSN